MRADPQKPKLSPAAVDRVMANVQLEHAIQAKASLDAHKIKQKLKGIAGA